jgi:hypothetical protein
LLLRNFSRFSTCNPTGHPARFGQKSTFIS